MAGLVGTGLDYQNRALSGFIRKSAQDEEIDQANKELEERRSSAKKSNTATMTVAGGMAGAELGAMYGGEGGGPYGAAAGAVIGYLFGNMM